MGRGRHSGALHAPSSTPDGRCPRSQSPPAAAWHSHPPDRSRPVCSEEPGGAPLPAPARRLPGAVGPARCREGWQGSARQHLQPPGCPCLDGGACYSEAGDWGRGVKLREFIFLFRLEKVYNLVKESLPKKSDGQSGGQGAPKPALAPGGLLCGGLVRAWAGEGCVALPLGVLSVPSSPVPTDLSLRLALGDRGLLSSGAVLGCRPSWVSRRWRWDRRNWQGRTRQSPLLVRTSQRGILVFPACFPHGGGSSIPPGSGGGGRREYSTCFSPVGLARVVAG